MVNLTCPVNAGIAGVIFTGDRGRTVIYPWWISIQNKVLLDGMVVYNLFHPLDCLCFETDIIRSVDVYTGGFSALNTATVWSAVIDITNRDGNKKEFGGEVSVSPVHGKEPCWKPIKLDEREAASYLLTAKHSYLDKTSTALYPYINGGDGIPISSLICMACKVSVRFKHRKQDQFLWLQFPRQSLSQM